MIQGLVLATLIAAATAQAPPEPAYLDLVFERLYSYNFAGALAALDEDARARPTDPLVYSARGAVYLFSEFDRQRILELQFFEDNDEVTDRARVKPDPVVRDRLLATTAEAKKLATARLAVDPNDREALFAMSMALGVETDYSGFIEKRYFKTYSLSKESQKYARRLIALNPPVYDAYITLGTVEYVVSNLNFFFRLFVRFDQIEGTERKAIENLEQVIKYGRYYRPFAKILLAGVYLRDKRFTEALVLLKEVGAEYPGNTVIQKEIARAAQKAALPVAKRR